MFLIVSSIFILLFGFTGGILPYLITKSDNQKFKHILKYGSAFSGGILLGGGTLHLLAETVSEFNKDFDIDYPLPQLFAWSTCLLLLILEKFFIFIHGNCINKKKETEPDIGYSSMNLDIQLPNNNQEIEKTDQQKEKNEHDHIDLKNGSIIASIFLLFGLTFHSFLAGTALGAEEDESTMKIMVVCILSHKFFAAFALGVVLAKSRYSFVTLLVFVLFFSCSTPTGIFIGSKLALSKLGSIYLTSISAGTFLYVGFFEVLYDTIKENIIVTPCLGFAFMAILAKFG
eukprot:TRINITY_DN2330_c0_g1_i1.p1 TRINITY_DN2330_c0_g1~~TRINITY_DN2330_c0_g1_i1.p1  ORF type:complete len:287 (+),score=57.82 TRINITY_DN2330_c0_g1_i1:154-1014(+)